VSDLTFAEVGEILHLLQGVDAASVELEWGNLKIQVRRGGEAATEETASSAIDVSGAQTLPPTPEDVAAPRDAAPDLGSSARQLAPGDPESVPEHWVAVVAPMAGSFYRSPKPDEPPYVEVGDVVAPGDPVALVEVMKLFTQLKAEVGGKVARIDTEDGILVEHGQALLWIEPA
jgi:acetyl-CoA carboxylase biotin carboxyl carrier protein